MKKKIKITESQYNILLKNLMETRFDTLTKSVIKDGDVVKIKINGVESSYKVVSSYGGQIQMDGMSPSTKDFRYFVNSSALDNNEITGKRINKVKSPELLNNPAKWSNFTKKIEDFQVVRNNNVVDAADINGTSSFNPNDNDNIYTYTDDSILEPLNFDDQDTEELKPLSFDEPQDEQPEEEHSNEENLKAAENALKMITSDPRLQDAFYRQPSFWSLFISDLQNKKATGKGIVPTLDLMNKVINKKKLANKDLTPFINGRIAEFVISRDIKFTYNEEEYTIPKKPSGGTYSATNKRGTIYDNIMGDYTKMAILNLKNDETQLPFDVKIAAKTPAIKEDLYNCDIYVGNEIVDRDVKIKFLPSNGYNNKTKQ